ncbi:WD repeat domain 21 isoform X2 [Phyllopteryx taeniolatus]|uniref:WD repeat domain 21 isoform X2 n=1 Tax=Phyllopteryx taeniolatus TaxID=161469 RepID=UPI002AD44DE1|nr:WD repeat domain 21 isoform X2 [Phyllopteryx taeniolatus]
MKRRNWKAGQRAQRGQQGYTRHPGRRRYRGRPWRPSWNDGNGYGDAGPSSRISDDQVSSRSSSASSAAPELPGFYYDPEKNRYFRLLPGHNNCNPLTREQLRDKEREKERARMLVEDAKPTKKAPRAGLNSSLLLRNRHLGLLSEMSFCRRVHEGRISAMRRHKLDHQSTDDFRTIVADSKCEQVFAVNDVSQGGCKYGCISFSRSSRGGSLSVETCDNHYVTNCKMSQRCVAVLRSPRPGAVLGVGIRSLTSCLVRVPLLFSGCRSGEIFSLDARELSGRKATLFRQESAITSLRVLRDENYLAAADMSGQIKLWDIRARKPVQEYRGHYNEHANLPIHVSEPEGLLLAVGQDCYTRCWSLRDGRLLRTIPSPHPAANDAIPSVVFSSTFGGRTGAPGLLMAVKKDLYYFPYNTDESEPQRV